MSDLFLFGIYFLFLIPIAFFARNKMKEKSPKEFYLAGGKLGFLVLFSTLFATQYSGNTFLAFPGKTYRLGYAYMMSITFMMAMILGYLLYASKLRQVAREKTLITPADWIELRYGSRLLTFVCAGLMAFALMNFLLAQLMAMGHAFSGLTNGRIPYQGGVLFLALIVVIYETLGGMRSVAWTDVLQGVLMMSAVFFLGGYLFFESGGFAQIPEKIFSEYPEKILPPSGDVCRMWLSSIFILGLGGAMYPQGIQRIYAAKSTKTLKQSLALMVFVPLITVLFAYAVGIASIVEFPGLGNVESDRVMAQMLSFWGDQNLFLKFFTSLLMLGAVAAMMSTADSVLLSLSSILIQDFYAKQKKENVSDEKLLRLGKITSWFVMAILVIVALKPELTLWKLLEIKFELLIQVAPCFILGFYLKKLGSKQALLGIFVGCGVVFIGMLFGVSKWYGIHLGTLGCIANFLVCLTPKRFG